METRILQGEKEWNKLKQNYEKDATFSLIDKHIFQTIKDDNVMRYELEKKIFQTMEKTFSHYNFSCIKEKYKKIERYTLYFENERYIKKISCLYRIEYMDIYIRSYERNDYEKNSMRLLLTEEEETIADLFYKELARQHHIRLKTITGILKRNNKY